MPASPDKQLQLKPVTVFTHVPLFRHGELAHASGKVRSLEDAIEFTAAIFSETIRLAGDLEACIDQLESNFQNPSTKTMHLLAEKSP